IHLTISLQKLQQKALQQPKQKKSKSAEFLMGESFGLGRAIRGDRPDSTLAAHQEKEMALQAPAKERGNECTQNYFDPLSAEQTDPRHSGTARVSAEDELELMMLNTGENKQKTVLDDTFINIPGTYSMLLGSREEEVLGVKAGDLVLQWRLLPSKAGHEAQRKIMGRESTIKMRTTEEVIPHYAQQPREHVQPDMITLGSLSLQQRAALEGRLRSEWAKTKERLMALFTWDAKVNSHAGMSSLCLYIFQGSTYIHINIYIQQQTNSLSVLLQEKQEATPQTVEVRLRCLRATRDKLPRGLYTVSMSLHSRLGGPAVAPHSERSQHQWSVSTQPVEHLGRYYSTGLNINQSLMMTVPAACELVPSTVLVFQLIAAPDQSSRVCSSVHAWGAFPVCGPNLCHIQGRFKTPLIRGQPSARMDQFRKMEALISSDLDRWLCNLYFQVCSLPCHCQLSSHPELLPQPLRPQTQCHTQQRSHAGPGCTAGAALHSHRGSSPHLSADSACSSSFLPAICRNPGEKSDPCQEKAEGAIHYKKKPIKKTNSCGPRTSGSSAAPRQADKHKMQPSTENLSVEEMEEYTFSLQPTPPGCGSSALHLFERMRLARRMLPSELGLPLLRQRGPRGNWRGCVRQLGLIIALLALMWFVRLYLHYCSQWLYLQAIAVPVNKFQFHAHTVDIVYQSSLLHTREELAMVMVGPLTLNAVTFLLVLIRWGCQQIFGSLPSFTSKFIMAQGVWTVLDPLAVFAVDAVLGHLVYSPETPVGDAAKLYWHFYRIDQSGVSGVMITLFLYAVLFLLSGTILFIYILRFHNDGRMLDVFQRLTAKEGTYFTPQDLEVSIEELSYIVKKAEQWRGFNGERRKVAVHDHVWTQEEPSVGPPDPGDHQRGGGPLSAGEISTRVAVYTLYLSGLKQRYRQFIRQPDGAIIEVLCLELLLTRKPSQWIKKYRPK
uniref:Orofacial cleft 1 candidate gene 1 protein n=1 Tax=Takifugu rubripes TaxID=31033 RepID=A0A674MF04_TAKRU